MKKTIVVLAILGLVGCKSLSDIRSENPDTSFNSSKSPDAVAECILYGWQSQSLLDGPMKVYIQPAPEGKTVYTDSFLAVADISKMEQNESNIKLYLHGLYKKDDLRKIALSCK